MINFTKMHGLGNDFIVIDAINQAISLTIEQIKFIANRHIGIGCDQLLLVENPVSQTADFKYRIFNADGSEAGQCGNGARCFARFVRNKRLIDKNEIVLDTQSGQLILYCGQDGLITVNMGIPKHKPIDIPLQMAQEARYYNICVNNNELSFGAVSIGNPHALIQVDNIQTAPVAEWGAILESHPIFPKRANIGFMQVINRHHIKLRVYERGVAETLACGSGACAAVVIGTEQQLLDRQEIQVELTGGNLSINWSGRNQAVFIKGSADFVFEGQIKL